MTDQIYMIYLKIFLYFGLYQNHLKYQINKITENTSAKVIAYEPSCI